MNFFHPIGDFYVDECCKKAGYNHLGILTIDPVPKELALPEEPKKRKKKPKKDEPST